MSCTKSKPVITHVIFDVDGLILDAVGLPLTIDEYLPKLKELLAQKFPSVELMPGAEKLVHHLHKHNIPIAVATGSDRWGYTRKIASHQGLFSLFQHSVTATDDPEVHHGKPAPDVFLVCAKRFGDNPKPEEILVFEDAPNGVQSGLAAGMKVIWVPDSRADRTPYEKKVEAILDSLEQFQPEAYGLPAYNSGVI